MSLSSDASSPPPPSCFGRLKELGIQTALLSGDREEAVASIGKIVGIESELVQASLTPRRKSQFISDIQASGRRIAMVATNLHVHQA